MQGQFLLLLGLGLINRFKVEKKTASQYLHVLDSIRISCVCATVCKRKRHHGPWMQLGACQAGVKGAHKPTHASPPPNAPTRKQHMHTSAPDSCRLMTVCALWIVCVGGVHACLRRCTHSLTHVEIWLPYFTAPTAFVNANCFPASPTPSLRCDWTIPRRLWLLTNWRNNPPGMGGWHVGERCTTEGPPPPLPNIRKIL